MKLDQIGAQNISQRRRPSPVRNLKDRKSAGDWISSQNVHPRGRPGSRPERSRPVFHEENSRQSIFTKLFRNLFRSNQKTPQSGVFPQDVSQRKRSSYLFGKRDVSGRITPASFFKTAAIACGVLALSAAALNWDNISLPSPARGISDQSLRDPGTPPIMQAAAERGRFGEFSVLRVQNDSAEDGMFFEDVRFEEVRFEEARFEEVRLEETRFEETPINNINIIQYFETSEHRVLPGESVSRIAAAHGLSMGSIIALNGITDATLLQAGRVLRIPNMDGIPYTVRENDTISQIAERQGIPVNAILDANDLRTDALQTGQVLFLPGARMNSAELTRAIRGVRAQRPMIYPLAGPIRITSGYGWRLCPINPRSGVRRFHDGIDIAARVGTPIRAVMDGFVEEIGYNRVYGNFIILRHENYRSLYAHLSASSVSRGARVRQGQMIGRTGASGMVTGPHLHFAVYNRSGNSVNPVNLLR